MKVFNWHDMRKLTLIIASLFSLATSHIVAENALSSSVRQFLNEYCTKSFSLPNSSSKFVSPEYDSGKEVVDVFISIDNSTVIDELAELGINVHAKFDGFVTARVPVDLLEHIATMPGVSDVDVSRRVELCTDSTLSVTHAGEVINGAQYDLPQSYDGTGVIVGVIDVGFDYQHRAFRKADNPDITRIVRIYDTRNTSGHPVMNSSGTSLPGSVFMNEEIYSLKYDSNSTHGTHTSSIAAGTHVNGYGGMAPGADIVLCAVKVLDGGLSTVEIANCVNYITCYADSVGKPCVISMSVSTATGQHDGQDYLSRAIAQKMGKGRIFVISAGNCGDRPMYIHSSLNKSNPVNLLFKCKTISDVDSSYYYSIVNSDIWMRGSKISPAYRWHILDLKTHRIVWQSDSLTGSSELNSSQFKSYYDTGPDTNTEGILRVTLKVSSNSTGYGNKYNLDIDIGNLECQEFTIANGVKLSRYALGISIYPRDNNQSELDAWFGHSSSRAGSYPHSVTTMSGETFNHFYTPSNNDCTIGTYAVNDSIISAGAFAARNNYYSLLLNRIITNNSIVVGEIANFSSFQIEGAGPTGEALPTICAPGICVVGAANRYSYLANHKTTVMKTEDGSCWGILSGTSMSAPTVAGIIALWLQANPNLSVSQIKNILAESAIRDEFTMGQNSSMFGPNGKIDAMAGMRLVLQGLHNDTGDVNCDGHVNMNDLTLLISHLLGFYPPDEVFSETNADMDHSGNVGMDDITEMVNYLLNI